MRKYLRAIARHNMQQAGIERMNKPTLIIARISRKGPSYFATHWREWVSGPKPRKRMKRKRLRTA